MATDIKTLRIDTLVRALAVCDGVYGPKLRQALVDVQLDAVTPRTEAALDAASELVGFDLP